jgi:hypothetical protein
MQRTVLLKPVSQLAADHAGGAGNKNVHGQRL